MIYYIGVGLIMFGIGLFVGRAISSNQTTSDNGFLKKFKEKQEQKRKEKEEINKIKQEAKMEAMKQLKPEFVKQMKEQEIKKMTGQDKKDKLKKFAEAFSMGDGFNSTEKLNRMLGREEQPQPQYQQQPQRQYNRTQQPPRQYTNQQYQRQQYTTVPQNQIRRPTTVPQNQPRRPTTNPNQPSDPFSKSKINIMLGKQTEQQRAKSKKDETQRIIDFLK